MVKCSTKQSAESDSAEMVLRHSAAMRELENAQAALRDALLAGQSQAKIRHELAKLAVARNEFAQRLVDREAERQVVIETEITVAAALISDDVSGRLNDLARLLAPSPAPPIAS